MAKFPTDKTADKTHFIDHEIAYNASIFTGLRWADMKLGVELVEDIKFCIFTFDTLASCYQLRIVKRSKIFLPFK